MVVYHFYPQIVTVNSTQIQLTVFFIDIGRLKFQNHKNVKNPLFFTSPCFKKGIPIFTTPNFYHDRIMSSIQSSLSVNSLNR